mgnify:FL=1
MTVTSITRAAALFALIALLAAGCGRKGDLDVPPSPYALQNPDASEEEKEREEEDRPFFLDALIQ